MIRAKSYEQLYGIDKVDAAVFEIILRGSESLASEENKYVSAYFSDVVDIGRYIHAAIEHDEINSVIRLIIPALKRVGYRDDEKN